MILTRTLSCYLVLAVTALILAVGRTLRKRAAVAQPPSEPAPVQRPNLSKRTAPPLGGYADRT